MLNDWSQTPTMLGAGLTMTAGVAVLGAIAFLLCASAPRLAQLAWAPLIVASIVSMFGKALDLPAWLMGLSPHHHVPSLPAAQFNLIPVAVLCLVTAGLVAVGFTALPHRDVGRT